MKVRMLSLIIEPVNFFVGDPKAQCDEDISAEVMAQASALRAGDNVDDFE